MKCLLLSILSVSASLGMIQPITSPSSPRPHHNDPRSGRNEMLVIEVSMDEKYHEAQKQDEAEKNKRRAAKKKRQTKIEVAKIAATASVISCVTTFLVTYSQCQPR